MLACSSRMTFIEIKIANEWCAHLPDTHANCRMNYGVYVSMLSYGMSPKCGQMTHFKVAVSKTYSKQMHIKWFYT